MKIKALSLWEPWASLMRLGMKSVETRSWETSYRGPLLICAAKKWGAVQKNVLDLIVDLYVSKPNETWLKDGKGLLFGKAACIVDLVECMFTSRYVVDSYEEKFGDYSPDRYAWITKNLRVIEPFPVRGAQGLFEVELPEGISL